MTKYQPYKSLHEEAGEYQTIDAIISPVGQLKVLSKVEVATLLDSSKSGLYKLFRNCYRKVA